MIHCLVQYSEITASIARSTSRVIFSQKCEQKKVERSPMIVINVKHKLYNKAIKTENQNVKPTPQMPMLGRARAGCDRLSRHWLKKWWEKMVKKDLFSFLLVR